QEAIGTVGKKILNDLEAEFFSLEEKSLEKIKSVIDGAFSEIHAQITSSAAVAYVKDDILYAFLVGSGSILLRRQDKVGVLLDEQHATTRTMQAASGKLEKDDLVVLQTVEFQTLIGQEKIMESLKSTADSSEIAETLTPLVHGKEEGAASAIFFTYLPEPETALEEEAEILSPVLSAPAAPSQETPEQTPPFTENKDAFPHPVGTPATGKPQISSLLQPLLRKAGSLTHKQRLLISIAGILVFVLLASIVFTVINAKEEKAKEVFATVYEPAQQRYEEGNGLIGLNTTLAKEKLEQASDLLKKGEDAIPVDSQEGKKISALQEKIQKALEKTSGTTQASVSPASSGDSTLLGALLDGNERLFATQDEETVYFLTEKHIKKSGDDDVLVTNNDFWNSPAGLGTFLGNLYVLDKKEGILKFVKGSENYAKSSYLTGEAPDLSKAVSMTIDSSIYVLFTTGDIAKFTKGAPDTFKVSGLDTPLREPKRIFTTPDFTNIYILDSGNSRIVSLGKDGAYKEQYKADALKKARDFTVDETNKKAYFLIEDKIYKISLQ
ncbi:MAG: hypothetical protein RLZZ455_997, partial [Candidatus Parcubacteria bacterium]